MKLMTSDPFAHDDEPVCAGGITRLGVQDFRNYSSLALDIHAKQIVLTGANGIGKTNLLEAISLLSPGRGLRSAKPLEWRRMNGQGWGVSLRLEEGTLLNTTSPDGKPDSQRRIMRHQGVALESQASLADYAAIVWLTPQMDGLFLDEAAERRKFIDRLVYAVNPYHALHLQRYDYALRQRNRLLKDKAQKQLIQSLHPILVAEGIAVAAGRLEVTQQLNDALSKMVTPFPVPILHWQGQVENWLLAGSALTAEQHYASALENNIDEDRMIGQTRLGVHRSDVLTMHSQKNMPAFQCSTGEQKALLLSLVLAHAQWLKTIHPHRPLILLLDDITAHFDQNRRLDIFEWITQLPAQTWLTGTHESDFESLLNQAMHFQLPLI